jgi:tetratricopeptide (TPR) repeat protein
MIIAKECFLAYHSIFKFKILDGFRRLTYALAITVAIGMLLHSLTVYAFSLAREIKYHEEIYRQRLIEQSNELAQAQNPDATIQVLERLLRIYPDDSRNYHAQRRVATVKAHQDVSNQLMSRADSLKVKGSTRNSLELYRAAVEVWPSNSLAQRNIVAYHAELRSDQDSIESLYDRCKEDKFSDFNEKEIKRLKFVFRDTSVIFEALRRNSSDPVFARRVLAQICNNPLSFRSKEEYFSDLKRNLFGDKYE